MKEAICSGEATEEDFANLLSDEAELIDENTPSIPGTRPTSSSISNIGLPPLENVPSTSVSSLVSPDALYQSPRQGRVQQERQQRPTQNSLENQESVGQRAGSTRKLLEDRMVTEILQIQNGFATFNQRDSSNTRNWSGWRGISSNSSRTANGFKIRRGRVRKLNSGSKDFSKLTLSEESKSLRKLNSSCEWDLVRGGCKLLNNTNLHKQRARAPLSNKVDTSIPVSDIFMRCDKISGCPDEFERHSTDHTQSTEKNTENADVTSLAIQKPIPKQNKQNKNANKKIFDFKSNLFNIQNLRDKQLKIDHITSKKKEISELIENKSLNEIRKTHSQVSKQINNAAIIGHKTTDGDDHLQKTFLWKKNKDVVNSKQIKNTKIIEQTPPDDVQKNLFRGKNKEGRIGRKESQLGGNNKANYPNGWAGPKPNCAWDGPGACKKKQNKKKQNKPKEKKFIDTIAAISNFRHEKNNSREGKTFIETKIANAVESLRNEKLTKDAKKEDNVIIEKSRFTNLFPKRLKPLDPKEGFDVNRSKDNFEDTSERVNKSSDPFDRSNLFPGKTIRERIKENLRQRERERNKHSTLSVETSKPKTKKIVITPKTKLLTPEIASKTQAKSQKVKTQKVSPKQKAKRKQKKKEREGRVGFQIWSVKEWLRRG